jgi:Na+/proline symporter
MHPLDYAILGFYLVVMLLVGVYFSREQHTSRDFFLAGRSMRWFPLGLSIMATLLSALSYAGHPAEAYYVGWKLLLVPAAAWLTFPIMAAWVLPLYNRLEIYSIYEYLEMRYDANMRYVASGAFLLWRLLWLGGVLYAPCKVLSIAGEWDLPLAALIIVLGMVTTLYTFLGGMKAVIWTDVIQSFVMLGGVLMMIGGVWLQVEGGPDRVRDVAESLGRSALVDPEMSWSDRWSIWGAAPHWFLALLSFYMADQITVQRYLTAKDPGQARRSFALNCVSLTIMTAALAYVGLGLLAFYQDHPEAMRPNWVANVDNATRGSLTDPATRNTLLLDPKTGRPQINLRTGEPMLDPTRGTPLIAWNEPITPETIDRLVAQRRLLRPNTKEPFESANELLITDPETGEQRIDVLKLAMLSPPQGELQIGEVILNRAAQDELLPRFIARQLPWGAAGLIVAALLAASMSSMDSGLNSICTLLLADFHRRLGWGRTWLARRVGKTPEQLSEADELRLARPMTLAIGVAATLFSLIVARIGTIFDLMISIVNTFGGPLLAIFLLAIFTRRTTARGVLTAFALGVLLTLWLTAANQYSALAVLWPFPEKLAGTWPLIFGVVFTLAAGYFLSLFLGAQKTKEELRGLTLGCGRLGIRHREAPKLELPPGATTGKL